MASNSCVAKGKCMGVVQACSGSSDCSEGDVCCASFGGAGGAAGGFPGGFGGGAGGIPGGLGGAAGGLAGMGGFGGMGGPGGLNITVACARSCGNGGTSFQLCSSNADCSGGATCQATMFGAKICGMGGAGFGGMAGGFGGMAGGFPGFADGGFGGFGGMGGLGGFGGFAGGGGLPGH
jgi:hypothetical protein